MPGVWRGGTRFVNWYVVEGGGDGGAGLTVVDAGLPWYGSRLDRLEGVEARVALPGHGAPWTDGVEAAVSSAREVGCR
ncbi:MAG: hypothetical protein ACLGIG_05395 [Actinomycetes bacterium]